MKKEELYPTEKQYSIVIIDLWDDEIDNGYKLLEVNNNELLKMIEDVEKELSDGEYLMIYDKNGITIEI